MKQIIIMLAIYLLASGIAFGQGSAYYYYKYQDREYLARHEDRVCVKFEQGTDVGSITGELEQAGVYPESASEVGRSVYTFEIQGALEVVLQNLRQMEEVSAAHPLYSFTGSGGELYLTNQLCVQFQASTSLEEIGTIRERYHLIAEYELEEEPYYLFAVERGVDVLEIANAVAQEAPVLFSHPNFYTNTLTSFDTPSDRYFDRQFNFYNYGQQTRRGAGTSGADIKMLQAWQITPGSPSILVTVIDDGLDLNHEDISPFKIVPGYDFADDDDNVQAVGVNAHGTLCAGLIAADHNTIGIAGISPASKLQMMKIGHDEGDFGTIEDVRAAIDAARLEADVISNSWGFRSSDPNYIPAIRQAILRAKTLGRNGRGCVVVFAAGNTANRHLGDNGFIAFPAVMPEVIAVGSSTRNDEVALYSPNSFTPDRYVSVTAPSHRAYESQLPGEGGEIWSLDLMGTEGWNTGTLDSMAGDPAGNYSSDFGGTSAACPQVAGAAALILALDGALTADQVKGILTSSADKVGGYDYNAIPGLPGASRELGFGRLNVFRALHTVSPAFQFVNRIEETENYGTLVIDNDKQSPVPSGSVRSFVENTHHVVRTNELPFVPNWNGTGHAEKHHRFYETQNPDFSLNHSFEALPTVPSLQDANFERTSPATIKTDLFDSPGATGGQIQFRDPWRYSKDPDNNWW